VNKQNLLQVKQSLLMGDILLFKGPEYSQTLDML